MKFAMTYLVIILVTVLMAVPKIFFNKPNEEASFPQNIELNIGFPANSPAEEKFQESIQSEPDLWNEPQPELESWMLDLREWNPAAINQYKETADTTKKGYGNYKLIKTISFTLLNV